MQGVSLKSPNRPTGVEKQLKCADGKKNCATLFGPHTALFRECLLRGVLVGAAHYLADNTARKRPNLKRVEAGKVLTCSRFSVPARLGSGRRRAFAECSQRQIHVITLDEERGVVGPHKLKNKMLFALHATGFKNVSPDFIASLEMEGKGAEEAVAVMLETDFRKSSKATLPFFPVDLQSVHTLTCDVVLQVIGVGNIGLPLPSRNEESNSRTLQLILTDGFTKAVGIEVVRIHALQPNMPPGFKLRYRGGRVINGRILLSPENVTCLFGGVAHLLENWKANQSALRGRALGLAQHADGKGPPPFDLLAPQASAAIRGLDDGGTPKSVAALPSPLCLDPTPSQEQKIKQRGEKNTSNLTFIDSTVEVSHVMRGTSEQDPLKVSLGQHRRTVSASETKGRLPGPSRVEVQVPSSSVVVDVRKIDWYVTPSSSNCEKVTSKSGTGSKTGGQGNELSTDSFSPDPALVHIHVEEAAFFPATVLPSDQGFHARPSARDPQEEAVEDDPFPILPATPKSMSREGGFISTRGPSVVQETFLGRGERRTRQNSHTQVKSPSGDDNAGGLGLLDFLCKKPARVSGQSKSRLARNSTNPEDDDSVWRCSQCTFDNHYVLGICEICETPR